MSARRTKNNRGQSQRANKQEGAIYMWNTRRNRENLPPLNNDTIFDFGLISTTNSISQGYERLNPLLYSQHYGVGSYNEGRPMCRN